LLCAIFVQPGPDLHKNAGTEKKAALHQFSNSSFNKNLREKKVLRCNRGTDEKEYKIFYKMRLKLYSVGNKCNGTYPGRSGTLSSRVVNPDPDWIRIQLLCGFMSKENEEKMHSSVTL
jgi:hypothetical protein